MYNDPSRKLKFIIQDEIFPNCKTNCMYKDTSRKLKFIIQDEIFPNYKTNSSLEQGYNGLYLFVDFNNWSLGLLSDLSWIKMNCPISEIVPSGYLEYSLCFFFGHKNGILIAYCRSKFIQNMAKTFKCCGIRKLYFLGLNFLTLIESCGCI